MSKIFANSELIVWHVAAVKSVGNRSTVYFIWSRAFVEKLIISELVNAFVTCTRMNSKLH
jgi:hypothetical protein